MEAWTSNYPRPAWDDALSDGLIHVLRGRSR